VVGVGACTCLRRIMAEFPRSEFPYLFELTIEHVLQPGYSYGNEFDVGLESCST
jgi:hypothetical protein